MDITTIMNDVNGNKWLLEMVLDRTSINTLKLAVFLIKITKSLLIMYIKYHTNMICMIKI